MDIRGKYFDSKRNSKFNKNYDININKYASNDQNNSVRKHRKN